MFFLQASQGSPYATLLFFASIFMIMYFFFLRPQVKKQKAQDVFVKDMGKGDEVVTTSGIIGKISKIENGIVHLQIDQKTYLRVVEGAISKDMTESLNKKEKDS